MKKIVSIAALAAVLLAVAPAQAMYKNLGKAFRTAVMNRTLTTKTRGSIFTNQIYAKKLAIGGALGTFCGAAYGIGRVQKKHKQRILSFLKEWTKP